MLTFQTLVDFPIELLVYVLSFVTSARDRVKLRYVSLRLRAAVEVPSLWRQFIWPNFDFREENSIKDTLKFCGRYVKRLSFPNLVIPIELLVQCSNVQRLSLPSVDLRLKQLRVLIQNMKKLQYLDILWTSKYDIKYLLLMIGYPCCTIKELTIRERLKSLFGEDNIHFLLNEWTELKLLPRTINLVSYSPYSIKEAIGEWTCCGKSTSTNCVGNCLVYGSFAAGIPPLLQYKIFGPHCLKLLFVNSRNYGLLGLDNDKVLLANRTIDNGDVICSGVIRKRFHGKFGIHGSALNAPNIKFITHFSVFRCSYFYSGHLEQLAISCPNLNQLNISRNVNCLKNLQGLRAIAQGCKKIEGLNISEISVDKMECSIQLWDILVALQLAYLSIDCCCLLCLTMKKLSR